ncbi:hydrolase [Dysgonomonas sp. 520]|nr:hydrolase [Dysgonomonas sp. 520]
MASICLLLFTISTFALDVKKLTCEFQEAPLAINTLNPRFGWQLASEANGDKQTAYQITVNHNGVKIWDSGKVKSDQSQLVNYKGKSLQKGQRYVWSVKVWDAKGKTTESNSTYFQTEPDLTKSKAKWVGAITREASNLPIGRRDFHGPSFKKQANKDVYEKVDQLALRSIMLRKSFNTNKEVVRAIIYVSGLGHYNLSVNGEKVSKDIFTPVWSDYDKTVYYNTYQVDTLLNKGENILGVTLGNGFYNAVGNRYRKLWVTFGPPTLFLEMYVYYKDGTEEVIVSDTSWKYDLSPITFNDIYGGEDYDARLEQSGWDKSGFDDSAWKPVVEQGAPEGTLRSQVVTSVRRMKEYGATSMSKIDSSYVLDMGQNLAGYPEIKVMGKKGQTVKLTVGEILNEETGKVSQKQSGSPHTYSYTLKGDGVETWHPEFTYYGFQYIQIDGANVLSMQDADKPLVVDVKSHFIHNSTPERGHFESSNEIFNKAHILIKNAVKSNMQSVFTDCPHREKLGWLEETHLNGPGLLYNWDLTQFYPKIMQDMKDAQKPGGLVPTIVPEYVVFDASLDVFRDSPEWGIASIIDPWLYYKFYGDDSLLRDYFDVMTGYVDHMLSRSDNYIASHGLGDWYDYGEHRAGFSKNSPVEVSATAHLYYGAHLVAEAAKMLSRKDFEKKYREIADNTKKAFNDKFFDKNTMQYGNGSQFCNAVAIFMGLVDPKDKQAVMENLKADIHKHGDRLTTGDVGNRYLFQALALNGENELMYLMHNHTDAPGYGFQINFGVTTLSEQWDPRKGASWNHFMMGQIDEWFFRTLAGIEPMASGFKEFKIEPKPVGDLEWVKADHETLYGKITVDWKKKDGFFNLSVDVPANTRATVVLPDGKKQVVGSGKYNFECKM